MKRRRSLAYLLPLGLSLVAACGGEEETPAPARTAARSAAANATVAVPLEEQNRSGSSGTATLRGGDRGFTVTLAVKPRREHPAHIHNVTCEEYRAIKGFDAQLATVDESLTDVQKGRSKTSVDTPLSRFRTGGFSINVHSYESGFPVVACGDIPTG
jgi:hypothetical protein